MPSGNQEGNRPDDNFEDEAVERDAKHHGIVGHALIEGIFAVHAQVRI